MLPYLTTGNPFPNGEIAPRVAASKSHGHRAFYGVGTCRICDTAIPVGWQMFAQIGLQTLDGRCRHLPKCSGRAQEFSFAPKTRHLRVNEYTLNASFLRRLLRDRRSRHLPGVAALRTVSRHAEPECVRGERAEFGRFHESQGEFVTSGTEDPAGVNLRAWGGQTHRADSYRFLGDRRPAERTRDKLSMFQLRALI